MRLYPLPSAKTLETIERRAAGHSLSAEEVETEELARARSYWLRLLDLAGEKAKQSKVLLVSSTPELFVRAGDELGFRHVDVLTENGTANEGSYDICVAVCAVERMADPALGLARLYELLKMGGKLLLVAPLMDSWPARFCRDAWTELRPENRFYFSARTLRFLLLDGGFHRIWTEPDRRRYSLARLERRARMYPTSWLTRLIRTTCGLVPETLREQLKVRIPTSACLVTATKTEKRLRPKLSIVMPVYNEITTFEECFRAVSGKEVPGLEKEIIVVESNSSDGTREVARSICRGPTTRLILQEKPAGKGNAVRAGLGEVRGDIVLIQDADLEYDVEDYDELVKPILQRRAALVLGSRHTGTWKLRRFNDQPLVASFFNLGHVFFCAAINLMFGQSMKDPFTMYKVFQKDCLYGLALECDRFDFDFEILIKILRKQFEPLELPVNYRARSLSEGKKVTAVRDPLTWIRALVKYRFCKIPRPPF
jgi:SAM-dependent methyltransferase